MHTINTHIHTDMHTHIHARIHTYTCIFLLRSFPAVSFVSRAWIGFRSLTAPKKVGVTGTPEVGATSTLPEGRFYVRACVHVSVCLYVYTPVRMYVYMLTCVYVFLPALIS